MGELAGYICQRCRMHFSVSEGGGIHVRFVKGLPGTYAVSRSQFDREIQENEPGEFMTGDESRAALEAKLDPCPLGGRFRYDASARSPDCRSTAQMWDWDPTVPSGLDD